MLTFRYYARIWEYKSEHNMQTSMHKTLFIKLPYISVVLDKTPIVSF